MSTASISASVAAATQGNEFEFYGPPKTRTPAVEKALLFTARSGGGIENPAKTIKANFPAIQLSPFGARKRLAPRQAVGRLQAVRAAIECGYGKRGEWASSLALNRVACRQLSRYMLARLELAAACVQRDANQAYYPREFSKVLEKSETGMLAFTLGSMGTYLAARQWLKAGGVSLSTFLHYDIWSKARVPPGAGSVKGKQPDFLVADSAGNWHVFESKGGRGQNRWARLAEGLQQLSTVTQVGWAHGPLVAPQSKSCVHTSVDPGEPLRVMLVDPVETAEPDQGATSYSVIESMSKLMVALDTIDLFDAMTGRESGAAVAAESEWTTGVSSAFGGLQLRLPSLLLRHAAEARRYVNLLLWARERMESSWHLGVEPRGESLADALLADVTSKNWLQQGQLVQSRSWYLHAQQILIEAESHTDTLSDLSSKLQPRLDTERLTYLRGLGDAEDGGDDIVVTTGGLHISVLPVGPRLDERPRG